MQPLSQSVLADMRINIAWEKNRIHHQEQFFAKAFNFWRDIFPGSLFRRLVENNTTDTGIRISVAPGQLVPAAIPQNVHELSFKRLRHEFLPLQLVPGRYYPRGMLSGLAGIFKENTTPFQVVTVDGNRFRADLNHPMAGMDMRIGIDIVKRYCPAGREERGGTCTDWMGMALDGPGIQDVDRQHVSEFLSSISFQRDDPSPDTVFYAADRFVHHIDRTASGNLSGIYRDILVPGGSVLDLMAGWVSHLPDTDGTGHVHGVGLNASEMKANPRLDEYTVQDLNKNKRLPFEDHRFDSAVCSLSVEYLTDPVGIFKEVARILKPGGAFAVGFSNRWFPEKAIQVWKDLHDFERMGLVTRYFLQSERFDEIYTISKRGYPRPAGDKYSGRLPHSDPVYAVIGRAKC